MQKVTVAWLRKHDACKEQVDTFKAEWPKGTLPTEKALLRAVELGLDIDWLAGHYLTAPALAEYERVTAQAWAEYERVTAPALAEYQRVRAPALAEYQRVTAPALAEYKRVRVPALARIICGQHDAEAEKGE